MRMTRKGQAHIMEYFLLSFFIMIMIVLIVILLVTYQVGTAGSDESDLRFQKAMFLLKSFSNSPFLNRLGYKEGSMLEDSKLSAMLALPCEDLQVVFGGNWFAEVKLVGSPFSGVECDGGNYPNCGVWKYCSQEGSFTAYDIPVNIYRKSQSMVEVGMLRVGYYV